VLASQLLRIAYQWVDAFWVGRISVEATAAVTSSIFVVWSVIALHDIFGIGVSAFVSQLLGAGERARAGFAAAKGLRATALMGLVGTALGLLGARQLYLAMGASPSVVAAGEGYLRLVLVASPILMTSLTCETIMRAAGDTRTPLLLDLGAVTLNAVLDPILIYGLGPAPALGVAGAAWATVISQTLLLAAYLTLGARGHAALPLARHAAGPPVRIAGMAKVGIPAALIAAMFSVVYMAFARSASRFGDAAMAVVGIANRVEAIQFVTSVAVGIAGATLVGQNLGARRPDRAAEVIRIGLGWAAGFAGVITLAYLAFPAFFLGILSRDPEVLRIGAPYLRVLALCVVFNAIEIVTAESILGSGHTATLSWIFTIFSLIRIPLAFWVPDWTGSGVVGIAWVITVTCVARALVIAAWASRGTWKEGLQRELHGDASWKDPPAGA